MAAVLTPQPATSAPSAHAAPWNDAPWNDAPGPSRCRPALTLLEGGRAPAAVARRRRATVRLAATVAAGVALAAAVALAATATLGLLGADAAAPGPASTAEATPAVGADASTTSAPTAVVVQPGDTLWEIARRLQPSGDPRPLVDALADRAGGPALVVGQRLDVTGLAD